ncbi:MAG: hypothetical protein L0G27_04200 [Paracoccus sp. (in: a-proteobacteria)]|nr:hypothetical protein [Paracoccus sp. (in: a-proteobacteria)]
MLGIRTGSSAPYGKQSVVTKNKQNRGLHVPILVPICLVKKFGQVFDEKGLSSKPKSGASANFAIPASARLLAKQFATREGESTSIQP